MNTAEVKKIAYDQLVTHKLVQYHKSPNTNIMGCIAYIHVMHVDDGGQWAPPWLHRGLAVEQELSSPPAEATGASPGAPRHRVQAHIAESKTAAGRTRSRCWHLGEPGAAAN